MSLFWTAFGELVARPMRSALTVSTFVISVAIAVVLISAGGGLEHVVQRILRDLGEGQVAVTPGRTTGLGGVRRSGRQVRLRALDLEGIEEGLPSFDGVAYYFDLRGGGATSWKYSIPWSPTRAVSRNYRRVRQLPIVEGRWFTPVEEVEGHWVTVLNEGLRRMIFRDHPAVGQWIEWNGRRMTVVGVVRDEALFPYIFFIPYRTVGALADARWVSGLIARPRPDVEWDRATRELRRVLGGIGGFDPTDTNAVEIETNEEFTARVRVVTLALHALVVTIAIVSILLGGLGVANMMVIGVTERTREIGLRKALGATRGAVFRHFFVEALVLLVPGGALGVVLGAVACRLVRMLPVSSTYTATVQFDLGASLLCVVALGGVAMVSATLPARRASRLAPAEALRWE